MMDGADASATRRSAVPESTAVAELGRAHPIKKRRRHHTAPDNWRRRVANFDHRQRVGITPRHVSVRAAHGDVYRLCAQQVTRERERACKWASKLEGRGSAARRQRSMRRVVSHSPRSTRRCPRSTRSPRCLWSARAVAHHAGCSGGLVRAPSKAVAAAAEG